MFVEVQTFRKWSVMTVAALALLAIGGTAVLAQDAPSADPSAMPRERELRDQLKTILQELEELQQKKEGEKPQAERLPIHQGESRVRSGGGHDRSHG